MQRSIWRIICNFQSTFVSNHQDLADAGQVVEVVEVVTVAEQQHSGQETSSYEVPSDTNVTHAPSVSGAASSIRDPKVLEQRLQKIGIGQFGKIVETNPVQNSDHEYDQLRNDPRNPYVIIDELLEKIKYLKAEGWKKDACIKYLRAKIRELKSGNLPKYTQDLVCRRRLKRKYCDAQIDGMISDVPKKRSKKWTTRDYGDAFKLLCNNGRKGYNYVRENLVLQPGLTTLQVKFSFLSFRPGFIRHIFTYIQTHLIHTDSWKNGLGKLAVFCYDEVSMSKLALYFKKFDCILGKLRHILFALSMIWISMHAHSSNMQSNFL